MIEEKFLNLMKNIYKTLIADIIIKGEKSKLPH